MRKFIILVLTVLILMTTQTALAIKGASNCLYEYGETGEAIFLLYENGRIHGALSPTEELQTVAAQRTACTSPAWIQGREALRCHAWAKVRLDENLKIIEGGTKLTVTILITDLAAVQDILGETFTVADIVDATIYSPDLCAPMPRAAHMFLSPRVREKSVGVIVFANGAELAIWCGDWDGDGARDLGFVALVRESTSCAGCTCGKCNCKNGGTCSCTCSTCKCKKTTTTCQPKQQTCQKSTGGCKKSVSVSLKVCVGISLDINLGGGCCK